LLLAELRSPKHGRHYGATARRVVYRRVRRTVALPGGQRGSYRTVEKRVGRGRAYTASAPGEPPAVYTGTLLRSVKVKQRAYAARIYADRR
ncbi:hypothetical protein ABTE65_18710, partial [Acinetobacter baumannii]